MYVLHQAYELASEGDELMGAGRHDEAGERYTAAAELAPGNDELLFWAGLSAWDRGERDEALRLVREAIAINPRWRPSLDQLPASVAPAAADVRDALGPQ